MPRTTVRVRPADKQDVPALLDVVEELRDHTPRWGAGRGSPGSQRSVVEDRLLAAVEDPAGSLLVALCEGEEDVCGLALLSTGTVAAVLGGPEVADCTILVSARHRRRGVGRALLWAAAAYAEEHALAAVAVTALPADRDSNRYYARLGFAPVTVTRIAPVSGLLRRLGGEAGGEGAALRRRLRLRARAGEGRRVHP